MRKLTAGVVGLTALVLGAGLAPSPALAKCSKDCKAQIRTQDKACKSACASDGDCAAGYYCDADLHCTAKAPNGSVCFGNNACASNAVWDRSRPGRCARKSAGLTVFGPGNKWRVFAA